MTRAKVRRHRALVTVVGHAAMISAGEFVQASGGWVNNRTHGIPFKAAFLRAARPLSRAAAELSAKPALPAHGVHAAPLQ